MSVLTAVPSADRVKMQNVEILFMEDLSRLRAKDLMRTEVITASPDELVAAARLRMIRRGVGGVPVVKNSKVVGILTLRDIEVAGDVVLLRKVGEIMTKDVVTISPNTPFFEILELMRKHGFQRLPVVERGRLVGIVTQSCIIETLLRVLKEKK